MIHAFSLPIMWKIGKDALGFFVLLHWIRKRILFPVNMIGSGRSAQDFGP
jgi:hypothetical protein